MIKKAAPDGKIPVGTVMAGGDEIARTLLKFHNIKTSDQSAEAFPIRSRRLSLKTREIHNLTVLAEQH